MEFEWNEAKAEANLNKHGVSSAAAASVWDDPNGIDLYDEAHSDDEDRF